MELCSETRYDKKIAEGSVKKCLEEYKLQEKVDALKNVLGIKNESSTAKDVPVKRREKKFDTIGVKDCLQPPIPTVYQALVTELRDTVRNSYWNKEIGKTVYLVPHLPAGCDPLATTFGKATIRQEHGVAEILNPRNDNIAYTDDRSHELYRKSHNDYDPSEQVDRKYKPPFNKFLSFGVNKKSADFSGRKAARCLHWFGPDSTTLVNRRLADFFNYTHYPLGKLRKREVPFDSEEFTFGKCVDEEVEGVADLLKETSTSLGEDDVYCSVYANDISRHCGFSQKHNIATGFACERPDNSHAIERAGAAKFEEENLGAETTAKALISPNVFTQMGLSHREFFKVRSYEEIRSIFENIGVKFPDNSFDVLWAEGLKKDCTGGVCVETFRNLLGRLAMQNFIGDHA